MAQDGVDLSGVAGRYAFALYELASEQGAVAEVSRALSAFEALLEGSPDLRRLASPVFSSAEQVKALDALLKGARIGGVAANFILLVAAKRRLFALPAMINTPEIRIDCPDDRKAAVVAAAREKLKADPEVTEVVTIDGVRARFEGGGGLVRASNTQPALVMRCEADTEERLAHIRAKIEAALS